MTFCSGRFPLAENVMRSRRKFSQTVTTSDYNHQPVNKKGHKTHVIQMNSEQEN